jgi:pyruvate dehydrogenase E2 component (dihydrolipoamide acetyltransferase)
MTDRYFRPEHVSAFRALAAVSWDPPRDPTILGSAEFDVTQLQRHLDDVRARTGAKVTMTHAVARALAGTLRAHPGLNCLIRRGKLWQRRDVDVFCQVAVPPAEGGKQAGAKQQGAKLQGADLSGVVVRNADRLDTAGIAAKLEEVAAKIRAREDPNLKQIKGMMNVLPPWLAKPVMRLLTYLTMDWGWNLRWLGVPDDPFGSVMVTSLGMFGIRHAYAPLFPNSRCIGVILVGEVYDKVVAVDGQPVVRPVLPLQIALDHRIVDGFQAAVLSREMQQRLQDPTLLEPGTEPTSAHT